MSDEHELWPPANVLHAEAGARISVRHYWHGDTHETLIRKKRNNAANEAAL